ncbi:MAG: hypothetical protein JRE40_04165 [Deltaproteobacteria bacterium]|nr:hypothetical protein [Deltaproteobacteria bacterium]
MEARVNNVRLAAIFVDPDVHSAERIVTMRDYVASIEALLGEGKDHA